MEPIHFRMNECLGSFFHHCRKTMRSLVIEVYFIADDIYR
jgi:hypothetical protein